VAFPQLAPHLPARWSQVAYVGTGLGAISLGRNPTGTIGQLSDAWQRARLRFGRPGGRTADDWIMTAGPTEGVMSVAADG
jgi:hypothetical protein